MKHLMRRGGILLGVIGVVCLSMLLSAVHSPSAAEIDRIKPEELRKLIESNDPNILVVDTQPKEAYALGHVKGAINFPWAPNIMTSGSLPRNKILVLYCDCAHEEDSTDVAGQLMSKFHYTNIKLLEGGWSKWQQSGFPIDK